MLGSAVFRTGVAPGGALAGPWVRNPLWTAARAVPSLDLRFADNKSLVDATTGQNLVTFTRASSGTYVDSQGVVRTATTNLLLQSNGFDTTWANTSSSETAAAGIAPDGTNTAWELKDTVDASAVVHNINQSVSITSGTTYTMSVHLKKGTLDFGAISFPSAGFTVGQVAIYNINTGTVSSTTGGGTAQITALNNGWYRCSLTATATATVASTALNIRTSTSTSSTYQGSGTGTILIWGAQLEQSSTVGEYIPTTSTINSAPRFDHAPTTGESLGLLVEESRTNLLLLSENLYETGTGGGSWIYPSGVMSNNTQVAPDGTTTADTLTTTGGAQSIYQSATVTASTTYTGSVYVRLGTMQAGDFKVAVYNNSTPGFIAADIAPSQTPTSTGWTRISYSFTTPVGCTSVRWYPFRNSVSLGSCTVHLWGAQLEVGAFPTSYIPTTTATATRSADVAEVPLLTWYNHDNGSFFASASIGGANTVASTGVLFDNSIFKIAEDGVTSNGRSMRFGTASSPNRFIFSARSSAVNAGGFANSYESYIVGKSYKGSSGYTNNSTDGVFAVLDNRVSFINTTPVDVPVCTRLLIGRGATGAIVGQTADGYYLNGRISRITYWPRRLSDSTLQQITQ